MVNFLRILYQQVLCHLIEENNLLYIRDNIIYEINDPIIYDWQIVYRNNLTLLIVASIIIKS